MLTVSITYFLSTKFSSSFLNTGIHLRKLIFMPKLLKVPLYNKDCQTIMKKPK